MMNKQKIVSLTLAGAIGVGSCVPAMAVNTVLAAKSSFGSLLGISQNNATNTSKKDVLEKLSEDELEQQEKYALKQLEQDILEAKQEVMNGITGIINIVRYNALAKRKITEEEAKKQHEELKKELEKADIERNRIHEEILENFEKAGMDEEAANINIKKADENFNKLIKETNKKHEAIEQAKEEQLKKIEQITNETEEKLAIIRDEIFKAEGKEIEAAFEEAKEAITARTKTATVTRLNIELRKFEEKYLETARSLQELGELINKFTNYQKTTLLKQKLKKMRLEPQSVDTDYKINFETFDKDTQARLSLYKQLKLNRETKRVFYGGIETFNDKLKKHPEVFDMLKKLFGKKFKTLIDASNQFIRVANSKEKEELEEAFKEFMETLSIPCFESIEWYNFEEARKAYYQASDLFAIAFKEAHEGAERKCEPAKAALAAAEIELKNAEKAYETVTNNKGALKAAVKAAERRCKQVSKKLFKMEYARRQGDPEGCVEKVKTAHAEFKNKEKALKKAEAARDAAKGSAGEEEAKRKCEQAEAECREAFEVFIGIFEKEYQAVEQEYNAAEKALNDTEIAFEKATDTAYKKYTAAKAARDAAEQAMRTIEYEADKKCEEKRLAYQEAEKTYKAALAALEAAEEE